MILLLGAHGFIAQAFIREMQARGTSFATASRDRVDYTDEAQLRALIETVKPSFICNCAAYIPQPSVDLCKEHLIESLDGNARFPTMLSDVAEELDIPLGHISTACLYDDRREYSEEDAPTRDFKSYCGTYLSHKYIAGCNVSQNPKAYIWRIRLPFDEYDSPRNYLTKLRSFKTVWYQTNSLTHRGDFVKSALDMIERRVAWGTYNCCNKGQMNSMEIVSRLEHAGIMKHPMIDIHPLVPGCRLSTAKLEATGCGMRSVAEAVEESLTNWRTE